MIRSVGTTAVLLAGLGALMVHGDRAVPPITLAVTFCATR